MPTETANKPAIRIVKDGDGSETQFDRVQKSPAESTVCEVCFGTGVEIVPGKGARTCGCRADDVRRRFRESARIPDRYKTCTFDTFSHPNTSQTRALQYARTLVDDYPTADKRGLLLMGSVGVGKTHLAVAILRGLLSKGVPCLFYESGSLLKSIQDSYSSISRTSERGVLAPVYETEVLLLDELGSAVWTDWVSDTMYQIINTRYNSKKLTIFTTNFLDDPRRRQHEAEEISDLAPRSRRNAAKLTVNWRDQPLTAQTLEDRIGTRLRSRLYQMCMRLLIESEDYRQQYKELV